MGENKFRIYYEYEIDGKIHKGIESEASWFLLTQSGELLQHGPLKPLRDCKEYKKLIPLFYTTYKDKNLKEIYAGDIVESVCEMVNLSTNKPTGNFKTERYVVEWEQEKGRWNLRDIEKNALQIFGTKQEYLTKWYSVIGNIYENPELRKFNGDQE